MNPGPDKETYITRDGLEHLAIHRFLVRFLLFLQGWIAHVLRGKTHNVQGQRVNALGQLIFGYAQRYSLPRVQIQHGDLFQDFLELNDVKLCNNY